MNLKCMNIIPKIPLLDAWWNAHFLEKYVQRMEQQDRANYFVPRMISKSIAVSFALEKGLIP